MEGVKCCPVDVHCQHLARLGPGHFDRPGEAVAAAGREHARRVHIPAFRPLKVAVGSSVRTVSVSPGSTVTTAGAEAEKNWVTASGTGSR
jgi:hypothetical protein